MVPEAAVELAWRGLVVAAVVGSLWSIARLASVDVGSRLRSRFVMGVPWGTLVSLSGVLCVYLFVQGGFWHWNRPVVGAFTAVSIFYPTGWFFAGFAHSSPSHLVNNLTSALVFAPLAEYVFSHYPQKRGTRTFATPWTNPYVRAFVVFPAGVFLVGLATALFSWGPVIGFSGVVFAFVGFSLVRYPLLTVVALTARGVVRVTMDAFTNPVTVAETVVVVSRPSWYGVAVQGHALGLFLGVLLGALVLRRRDKAPDPLRLWVGSLLVASSLSLWALWWILEAESFVLFRALGVALVLVVATVITAAVVAGDRPGGRISAHRVAVVVLCLSLVGMGGFSTLLNANVIEPVEREGVEAGDYLVFYDEGIENRMVNVLPIEGFGLSTNVTTSGVIVASEERQIWREKVSERELSTYGEVTFRVGGIGWSEPVTVTREGYRVTGNDTVYLVWIDDADGRTLAYESGPSTADPVVADHTVSVVSEGGEFHAEVTGPEGTERVAIPAENETVSAGGIDLVDEDERVLAVADGTEVEVFSRERYREPPDH
ncbi:rhomboid family intramembrane serine protease [Natronorarus salvus]|uniref:rhomboid family intramembrane serine protease n=1 Tax=Natronorarus salvus TaxID=3117733 RepID=UPI002F269696